MSPGNTKGLNPISLCGILKHSTADFVQGWIVLKDMYPEGIYSTAKSELNFQLSHPDTHTPIVSNQGKI